MRVRLMVLSWLVVACIVAPLPATGQARGVPVAGVPGIVYERHSDGTLQRLSTTTDSLELQPSGRLTDPAGHASQWVWSAFGDSLQAGIWLAEIDFSGQMDQRQLTNGRDYSPAIRPPRHRFEEASVVFVRQDPVTLDQEVFMVDLHGRTDPVQLTQGPGRVGRVSVGPNGLLLYNRHPEPPGTDYTLHLDTVFNDRVIDRRDGPQESPHFAGTGSVVLFGYYDGSVGQLMRLSLNGGQAQAIHEEPGAAVMDLDVSADGASIAFVPSDAHSSTVRCILMGLGGGGGQQTIDDCRAPTFLEQALPVHPPLEAWLERDAVPTDEVFEVRGSGCEYEEVEVLIVPVEVPGTHTVVVDVDEDRTFVAPVAPSGPGLHQLLISCGERAILRFGVAFQPGADRPASPVRLLNASTPVNGAATLADLLFAPSGEQRGGDPGDTRPAAAHVVLSRDDEFADSLAGSPLADTGPLLFTGRDQLPTTTLDGIERLLPPGGLVYLLGGTGAISQAVEDELAGLSYEVRRLAGPTRVETAVAIAGEVRARNPFGTRALLARAGGPADNPTAAWADAVTGGAPAAAAGIPVLVTSTESLHPAVAAWFETNPSVEPMLLGGTAALSADVADALGDPIRIAGPDRASTAAAVSMHVAGAADLQHPHYLLLNGFGEEGWAFGLAATPLAVAMGAPLLLVGDDVPPATSEQMSACTGTIGAILLGSTDAVSDIVADEVGQLVASCQG